ncbi:MAG: hypothetical protein NDF56_07615 [archaeon GB-1845-036]|nr:hypothetical protein [Candidatus Culexmicrobium thermophilum]
MIIPRRILLLTILYMSILMFNLILTAEQYHYVEVEISSMVSNPSEWLDRRIRVEGVIEPVITIPEVKPPFNYWLIDRDNRSLKIGVRWDGWILKFGVPVEVEGVLRVGYFKVLSPSGWKVGLKIYYVEVENVRILEG